MHPNFQKFAVFHLFSQQFLPTIDHLPFEFSSIFKQKLIKFSFQNYRKIENPFEFGEVIAI